MVALDVLKLCELLGGSQFADAVCNAGSRSPDRSGTTPSQLATTSGHMRLAESLSDCHALRALELDLDRQRGGQDEASCARMSSEGASEVAAPLPNDESKLCAEKTSLDTDSDPSFTEKIAFVRLIMMTSPWWTTD